MDPRFIQKLENTRSLADIPFTINSGFRCVTHNKSVGGVVGSAHTTGRAVDIACYNSHSRFVVISAGLKFFQRVGIGQWFVHFDDDLAKVPQVIWLY